MVENSTPNAKSTAAPFAGPTVARTGPLDLPEARPYVARLAACVALGTQTKTFGTEAPRQSFQIYLAFELYGSADGRPRLIADRYTLSYVEKAKLRPVTEALLGRKLADDERADISTLLGRPLQVNVAHREGRKALLASIASVSPLLPGVVVPELTRPPLLWHFGTGLPLPQADWLPWIYGQKVSEEIQASPEYRALLAGGNGGAAPTDPATGKEAF
jgi:hypothetical protein